MREFMKAMNRCAVAGSLFSFKQFANVVAIGERGEDIGHASRSMDRVTRAMRDQIGPRMDPMFAAMDAFQGFVTDMTFFTLFPFAVLTQNGSRDQRGGRRNKDSEIGETDHSDSAVSNSGREHGRRHVGDGVE